MNNLKKCYFYYFLFILVVGVNLNLSAQTLDNIKFSNISIEQGLSQNTVFSIDQDKKGNMWFATYDGVNKYDGYECTVYQHQKNDSTSIATDITRVVKVDRKGRVWIGTSEGLSYYNESKDCFENYAYLKNNKSHPVNAIERLPHNKLLIATSCGLSIFDIEQRCFTDFDKDAQAYQLIPTALYRKGRYIYIGTANKGLYLYSIDDANFEKVTSLFDSVQIQAILKQTSNKLWVATEGDGLYCLNPKTMAVKHYRNAPSDSKSISSNYIRSLALDAQNRLWIGTFNDLNIYNEKQNNFERYTSDPLVPGSLSQPSVRSIYMDNQGGMWLGTYFGGLNYYHPLKNRFKNIRRIPYKNSLNDNIVSCIVEDKNKNLWIGTNDGGLNYYDYSTKHYSFYNKSNSLGKRLGSNNIKSIYIDENSNLIYIGTHAGGLNVLNRRTGKIQVFNENNSALPSNNVYAIVASEGDYLWLGTLHGLVKFNYRTLQFKVITQENNGKPFIHKQITALYKDSKGRLWIGSENGVALYTESLMPVDYFSDTDLTHVSVNSIFEASDHTFWIGTRQGVYAFDEEEKSIVNYSTSNGLPNNVIYGILEDSYNRLWFSSNKGLTCFSPQTKQIRNFINSDGLQSNQFNAYSYCRLHSGEMLFGGIKGITSFYPELLIDNPYTPSVVITRLELFNKTVRPNDETELLQQNISDTDAITFKHSQSAFSLSFVVSNYISGKHNTFAYQLKGYDKDWYYTTTNRTVAYSNLPQGDYTFMVKAANSDGKWNNIPTELKIIILPVWYKTWWALLLFFVIFVTVVYLIFRFFWLRKSMAAQIELERRKKEHQEEINQMKMRFFINISHELRTPLTLILAPLQDILDKISDRWICNQLEYIQRNANRLLHLVNQLMDYRRAEQGIFELKVKKGNLHELVLENFMYYEKLARHKKIDYNLYSELEQKEVLFDSNYIELILNNLLSNAFKYTSAEQSISVSLREENQQLLLQVKDTGIGIPINKQGEIFERFFQVESEHVGSGIGLSLVQRLVELHHGEITVESEEGKGSTFSVYLPQNESAYTPNEFLLNDASTDDEQVYSTNSKEMYFVDTNKEEQEQLESTDKKRGTILIVEDNAEIRHYLNNGLNDLFNTIEAENGEVALNVLKDKEIDVVITDVMMPVMDGIKLCKQIKQNIRTCHIPVIMLSAKSDIKDQMEGLHVGVDDYIPKPFSLAVVTAKIQNMMRTRYRIIERYSKSLEVEPEKVTFNAMDEVLIKRAVDVVEKNIDNVEFTTDEFAREMNMSRSNLHLKLKAITGESAIDFIRKIRFNKAVQLLKDGRYTVAEVSSMVGFNTPSYFATSFKKYFGCLPSAYGKKKNK